MQTEAVGVAGVISEEGGPGDKMRGQLLQEEQGRLRSHWHRSQEGLGRLSREMHWLHEFFFALKIIDSHDTHVVNKQINSDNKRDNTVKIILPSV